MVKNYEETQNTAQHTVQSSKMQLWCVVRPIKQIDVLSLQTIFTECVYAICVCSYSERTAQPYSKRIPLEMVEWKLRECVSGGAAAAAAAVIAHTINATPFAAQYCLCIKELDEGYSVKLFKSVCGKWLRHTVS